MALTEARRHGGRTRAADRLQLPAASGLTAIVHENWAEGITSPISSSSLATARRAATQITHLHSSLFTLHSSLFTLHSSLPTPNSQLPTPNSQLATSNLPTPNLLPPCLRASVRTPLPFLQISNHASHPSPHQFPAYRRVRSPAFWLPADTASGSGGLRRAR